MGIIVNLYLWMFPLLLIFQSALSSQKRQYVSENSELNQPLNYELADDYRVKTGFALLLFLPFVFISANRDIGFGDTAAYAQMFWNLPDSISRISISPEDRSPGFTVFAVFIKQIVGWNIPLFFGVVAAVSAFCLALNYRRYSADIVLCAFFFLTADFQGWMNNGIRQFMVVTVMFALTPLLISRKVSKVAAFIFVGVILFFFHVSVLVVLPIYIFSLGKPMNKRTLLLLALIAVAIIFVGQFTGLLADTIEGTNYERSTAELTSTTNGTNIFRVLFFSLPTVLLLVFRKKIPSNTSPIISFSINMSLIGSAFYVLSAFTNGVSIGRIPIYFTLYNYFLIPWEIKTFFKKESQKIALYVFIAVYFIFYLYQMWTWGLV